MLPVNNVEKFAIAAVAEEIQPQSALPRDPMREWIIGLILIVSGPSWAGDNRQGRRHPRTGRHLSCSSFLHSGASMCA
jgi:hypothetical protein